MDLERATRERDRKAFLKVARRPPQLQRGSDARLMELVSAYETQRQASEQEVSTWAGHARTRVCESTCPLLCACLTKSAVECVSKVVLCAAHPVFCHHADTHFVLLFLHAHLWSSHMEQGGGASQRSAPLARRLARKRKHHFTPRVNAQSAYFF